MKFLIKLEEALESPELPEEDKWENRDLFDWDFTVVIDSESKDDARKFMADYLNYLHQRDPNLGFDETRSQYLQFSPIQKLGPYRGKTAYHFEIEGPLGAFNYFTSHRYASKEDPDLSRASEYPELSRAVYKFQNGFVHYGRIASLLW